MFVKQAPNLARVLLHNPYMPASDATGSHCVSPLQHVGNRRNQLAVLYAGRVWLVCLSCPRLKTSPSTLYIAGLSGRYRQRCVAHRNRQQDTVAARSKKIAARDKTKERRDLCLNPNRQDIQHIQEANATQNSKKRS